MIPSFVSQIDKGGNNSSIMKSVISYFVNNSTSTIPELAKRLGFSVPAVTKVVNEMREAGLLTDYGKIEGHGGRRPVLYGINSHSGYFLGVDVKQDYINIGLINFMGEFIALEMNCPVAISETSSYHAIDEICNHVREFIDSLGQYKDKIYGAGFSISGRVNPDTGFSFSTLSTSEKPLSDILSQKLGLPVSIDNDSRAMTCGDYLCGKIAKEERNILFINLSYGLGMGIVLDGHVVKGRSGYSGELGHFPAFDNEIMCHCGKKGCLETEISGLALRREVLQCLREGKQSSLSAKYNESGPDSITLSDIIAAIEDEDMLCIEVLEEMGSKLGKWIAGLINIFNPELVVIGGQLSATGDYLLRPIKQSIQKYTLRLVSQDSHIAVSQLGEKAGVLGAALIARNHILMDIV